MTPPGEPSPHAEQAARQAVRVLQRGFAAYTWFAGMSAALLVAGLAFPARRFQGFTPLEVIQIKGLVRLLLVSLYASLTVTCIGLRWGATILAARRCSRHDPYPAALTVAMFQWLCLIIYGLFEFAALLLRLRFGAGIGEFFMATVASLFAAYYFLRPPAFLAGRSCSADRPRTREPLIPPDDAG